MSAGAAPAGRGVRFATGMRAVLERDFLVLTSSGRFVAFRSLVVGAVAALVVLILFTIAVRTYGGPPQPDEIGRAVFSGFFFAYPALVLLVAPSLGAGSIAGERALDTLPIVLAAPVSPLGFVVAKFLSRLGALLVPLLGGLPIAGVCFLYGGISETLFAEWAAFVATVAVLATSASTLASAYSRNVGTAVLAAYFLALVVPVLESWGTWALVDELGLGDDSLAWSHSLGYAWVRIGESVFGRGVLRGSILPFVGTTAVLSALALLVAAGRVSREAAAMAAVGPRRGSLRRSLFENPVLDRATLALPLRRGGWRSWLALLAVAGLTWLVPLTDFDDDEILVGLNFCTWTAFFVLLARATQAISTERQQGSLAVLLSTRLGAADVVRGKLGGLGVQAAVLLLPGIALAIAGAATDEVSAGCLVTWLGASAVLLFFFSALGLRISASAGTSGRAAAQGFAFALGGMICHGLFLAVVALLARHADDELMIPLASASPPVVLAWLTLAPEENGLNSDERLWLGFTVCWAVGYAVAGALLARSAAKRVERGE